MILLCFGLKNFDEFAEPDSCLLLSIIAAISASEFSTPVSSNAFFAFTKSFFFVISQRGLSGTYITITEYTRAGTANTPSIQRQSLAPPTPCKK